MLSSNYNRAENTDGGKQYLSLPAVGESDVKKIRSDINSKLNEDGDKCEYTGSTEGYWSEATSGGERTLCNVVSARRNLLGKKNNDTENKNNDLCPARVILTEY